MRKSRIAALLAGAVALPIPAARAQGGPGEAEAVDKRREARVWGGVPTASLFPPTSSFFETPLAARVSERARGAERGRIPDGVPAWGQPGLPDGGAPDPIDTPIAVTPEPLSMTLLATGLAGIAAVGLVQRRRRDRSAPR